MENEQSVLDSKRLLCKNSILRETVINMFEKDILHFRGLGEYVITVSS